MGHQVEEYALFRTFDGFEDSINCLQFDPHGQWLAAGGDDGRFAIFNIHGGENADISLVAPTPVTSLLWHPVEPDSIFVGYSNGAIFLYHIAMEEWFPSGSRIDTESHGPVEALDYDATGHSLAAIVGSEVIVCKLKRSGNGKYRLRKFPEPAFPTSAASTREISPCSLHYIDDERAIVVSYLYHGLVCWDIDSNQVKWTLSSATRITRSTISPDQKSIVVCNLRNGFDRYRIDHRNLVRTYSIPVGENVSLPASFIHNGDALLFGSACGAVTIVDKDDGSLVQTLDHAGDLVQAIAYVLVADSLLHFIATGSSERGRHTQIRVWRAGSGAHGTAPSQDNDDPAASDIREQLRGAVAICPQQIVIERATHGVRQSYAWYSLWVCGALLLLIALSVSVSLQERTAMKLDPAPGDAVVRNGAVQAIRAWLGRFSELLCALKRVRVNL